MRLQAAPYPFLDAVTSRAHDEGMRIPTARFALAVVALASCGGRVEVLETGASDASPSDDAMGPVSAIESGVCSCMRPEGTPMTCPINVTDASPLLWRGDEPTSNAAAPVHILMGTTCIACEGTALSEWVCQQDGWFRFVQYSSCMP